MRNDIEEKQYDELRKLGQKLHIPIPEAFWELEVTDKNGKVTQRHKQRSHSWVRNAYNLLLSQMAGANAEGGFGAGGLSVKDTGGTVRSGGSISIGSTGTYFNNPGNAFRAPAAIATYGIQVGSGTNAESFEDYVLQTPIAEGSGAGQLNHVLAEDHVRSWSAPILTITHTRYFNNNSGGDVSVNEVALTTNGQVSGLGRQFMVSRDKLAATVLVPNTGQLKIDYTIQLTYPS